MKQPIKEKGEGKKKCVFPKCEHIGWSRGKRADGLSHRCRFCKFHYRGLGKEERIKFEKNHDPQHTITQ